MMGFAEDEFMKYLQLNLTRLEIIRIDELLPHMTDCLSMYSVERLNTYVRNQGNMPSVIDFYLSLRGRDNWVTSLIGALKKCGHGEMAEEFERVYSSYLLPTARATSSQSLPPSLNHNNRQPPLDNPEHRSSLPGQMPPASLDTQPGPSQRFNQIQTEQETTRRSPSQQNHESRSLPPFRPDPPAPPRTSVSHDVSAEIHLDASRVKEDTARNPVPESTPYHTAFSDDTLQKEPSISENPHIAPDPLPSRGLSPSFKHPQTEVSIQPSSENEPLVKVLETPTTSSYSHSISSEGEATKQRGQPACNKTLPEPDSARMTVNTGQMDREGSEEQREQSIIHRAEGVADRRPVSYSPANRRSAQEEPNRERPADPPVVPGSSCRPLDNTNDSDEDYPSKPGVLFSALGFRGDTTDGGASSVLSRIPEFQISDCTESNESINISDRSSRSATRDKVPPASTPPNRSMQERDRRRPEENDFSFDSKSSPRRRRPLDQSSPRQPEENSFESRAFSHYSLQFSEDPEEDLMKGNDDVLRNMPRKTPNTSETTYENNPQASSKKAEGRDLERKVLITITVASVCLSLYLLLKSRQN